MRTLPELLLIGGGGHCRSCIDVIEAEGKYKIAGIVNQSGGSREQSLGYDVLGDDEDLPELLKKHPNALITVGQIKSADLRLKLFERVQRLGFFCQPSSLLGLMFQKTLLLELERNG